MGVVWFAIVFSPRFSRGEHRLVLRFLNVRICASQFPRAMSVLSIHLPDALCLTPCSAAGVACLSLNCWCEVPTCSTYQVAGIWYVWSVFGRPWVDLVAGGGASDIVGE